jgi:hypothetical protein
MLIPDQLSAGSRASWLFLDNVVRKGARHDSGTGLRRGVLVLGTATAAYSFWLIATLAARN